MLLGLAARNIRNVAVLVVSFFGSCLWSVCRRSGTVYATIGRLRRRERGNVGVEPEDRRDARTSR
jgi:hypothetical protein